MNKKKYQRPEMLTTPYTLTAIITMSWSDEETDEVLTNDRGEYNSNFEEDFWEGRE